MNDLVFIEPNKLNSIPFTTSDVIAEFAGIKNHAIQQLISKHEASLKQFGLVAFEIRAVKMSRGIKYKKIYHLTEEQATLLITFLKNTETVVAFKTELVRQFYSMRSELMHRQLLRQQLKPVRRELTDVIRDKPDMSKWAYKQFTDLAYSTTIGKSAAQLRKERGASKHATAIDYMMADEIEAITKQQSRISVLLEMGMDYQQIKMLLKNRLMVGRLA